MRTRIPLIILKTTFVSKNSQLFLHDNSHLSMFSSSLPGIQLFSSVQTQHRNDFCPLRQHFDLVRRDSLKPKNTETVDDHAAEHRNHRRHSIACEKRQTAVDRPYNRSHDSCAEHRPAESQRKIRSASRIFPHSAVVEQSCGNVSRGRSRCRSLDVDRGDSGQHVCDDNLYPRADRQIYHRNQLPLYALKDAGESLNQRQENSSKSQDEEAFGRINRACLLGGYTKRNRSEGRGDCQKAA